MQEDAILQLVLKVQRGGHPSAFNSLVQQHQSAVRRTLTHLCCGDTQTAEDLAQETFIKAYAQIDTFRKESSFSTWITRIAYRLFYDHMRRQKPTVALEEVGEIGFYANTQDLANATQRKVDVNQGLSQLAQPERTAMVLFYIEDKAIEDVAEIMGMPVGTVKSHLHRGKKKLVDYLRKNGYDG